MGKAIAGAVGVSVLMLALGGFVAFFGMVAMNGFSERTATKVFGVLALGFYAVHFLVTSAVARALLPPERKASGRMIGAVVTGLPALPTFALLAMI